MSVFFSTSKIALFLMPRFFWRQWHLFFEYSENGCGTVRAFNTTPCCLVIRFEGRTETHSSEVQERIRELCKKLNSDLVLPF